jgi:hypothetical protein
MKLIKILIMALPILATLLVPASVSATSQSSFDAGTKGSLAGTGLTLVETVVVQANSTAVVLSVNTLENGAAYVLKTSGTWQDTSQANHYNDAEYTTFDGWATHMDGTPNWGANQKDLMVNNIFVDWGDYNSAHEYELSFTGTGTRLSFMITDRNPSAPVDPSWYADNVGSLTVNVYKFTPPVTPVTAKLMTKSAKFDFKAKPDDYKAHVEGTIGLDLVNGDGADISEPVTITIGPLSETITMKAKGKNGEIWEYQRPAGGTGNIKQMTINWQNGNFWKYGRWGNFWKDGKYWKDSKPLSWNYGEFDIRMDKGELSGFTNPATISIQVGNDLGKEAILMDWEYRAH